MGQCSGEAEIFVKSPEDAKLAFLKDSQGQ